MKGSKKERVGDSGGFRLALLALLVLQNTLSALMARYTRHAVLPEELYDISQFILVSEIFKLVMSFLLELTSQTGVANTFKTHLVDRPVEMFKMAFPALLYWGSNTLLYVAISNLEVPIFQVFYQAKLVVTAIVSVVMLGRRYVARQWICLVVISVAVSILALEEAMVKTTTIQSTKTTDAKALVVGLMAVASACFLSAFAGVYFEKVLKKETDKDQTDLPPSLWMRNIQLAAFSIIVALANSAFIEGTTNQSKLFLHGFTPYVWCQVLLFAGGGLLVSAVIKHADNVLKGLATGISVLLSSLLSMIIYHTPLSISYAACAVATVTSVYYFNMSACPINCHSHRRRLTFVFLLSWLTTVITHTILRDWNTTPAALLKLDAILATSGSKDWNIMPEALSTLDVIPVTTWSKDWNTTLEALSALRALQNQVQENHFHEATHVLYDLRTHLGNRPARYLEIGSYTGISASLMLNHPFSTYATLVDPCALDKKHFNGTRTQKETIEKNMQEIRGKKSSGVAATWELRVGYSPGALPLEGETFDIIFIDGDHSKSGVWRDYMGTINLLRPGGFMGFDDYLDARYSPAVRGAVDDIATQTELVPFGTPRNIHGIHPGTNSSFINEYIFQKPGKLVFGQPVHDMENASPVLCVTVATYRRPDGATILILEKLWKMLEQQSYSNWKLYLTGDFYDNDTEWQSLSFYNDSQASLHNLLEPGERGKITEEQLWSNAGATAMQNAIERFIADGYEWNVHLDDDDTWSADHLQNIILGVRTGATFVMTRCQYKKVSLPTDKDPLNISHEILPKNGNTAHSSVAFNAVKLPTRFKRRDGLPADGYMWERIVYEENFFPAFVPIMSCYHMKEQGRQYGAALVRKSTLEGVELPAGWYNDESFDESTSDYFTLAAKEFPSNLSSTCRTVVGPNMGSKQLS